MSNLDEVMQAVAGLIAPLAGDEGPCGPDLEYDNAFLELTKAAEGKPETQFDKAVPPDWRAVRGMVAEMFERTRDLRVAILWLRAELALEGVNSLGPGLHLISSLLTDHWDELHPKPDPDDGDTFARENALGILKVTTGGIGDLLNARLLSVKGVGDIRLHDVEVALGATPVREGEPTYAKEQLERMIAGLDDGGRSVRAAVLEGQQQLKRLAGVMDERFGSGSGAELKPLLDIVAHALSLTRDTEAEADDASASELDADGSGAAGVSTRRASSGLSGSVNSRDEAVRAIDLVCAYLERAEPTNPAPLFLRRARALLERNFLELLKELAPSSLDEVARIVGIDPSTVGPPTE